MGIKPHNDWVLIKMDPETDEMAGGLLVKPETAHETILRTGVVLDVGPGKYSAKGDQRTPLDVEPGEGVVFVKFVADSTKTAEALQHHLGPDEALIKVGDILLAYDRSEAPEFL